MSPDFLNQEFRIYHDWSTALDLFFTALEADTKSESASSMGRVKEYREKVGQDLKVFQDKLSSLMNGDDDGQ